MAYIAQDSITNGYTITRTPVFGNAQGTAIVLGPRPASSSSTPSSGLVLWRKR